MKEWITCQLGDLITFQRGHDLPKTQMCGGEYPVVGSNGIIGYHNEYTTEEPSITIGRSGNVGKPFLYKGKSWSHNTSLYIKEFKGVDPIFIYYFLQTLDLGNYAGGSAVPTLNRNHIHTLEVNVPSDIHVQYQIASILSVLDTKIENNKAINQNLYEQIQTIYCKDFDPVSHEVTGVLSDICKLSTDKVQISDLSVSTYYSTENMQPNKAGAVDASSLPAVSQTTRCRKGDVLVSNIRPYFKKIVYVTEESGCSTDVLCFVPQPDYSAFLFGTLYMDRFFDYMVAGSKGTKMPRGDKQQIMKYPIVVPTAEAIIAFNAAVTPMLEQIAINNKENERLATMRDTLLPKLMSGELDVSEIEL